MNCGATWNWSFQNNNGYLDYFIFFFAVVRLAEYDFLKTLLKELEARDRSSTVKDWATGGQVSYLSIQEPSFLFPFFSVEVLIPCSSRL